MASVTLKNIRKVYESGVCAVNDFNLEIKDKEFVVLVGPSGCGKSTTLRMIAGLEEITSGELYIGDNLVNNVLAKNRNISMVFQDYALFPHLTVHDNMAFPLKMRKLPKKVIDEKVNEAAEILGIQNLLNRKPKVLSGGQRQRVAIGRSIVRDADVFLMDEPLSNLDAKLRNQMRTELIRLRQRLQTTFVYVTHDQTEAMTLGDRIVIMKDGFIQQIGAPDEVYSDPTNVFVGGFIGIPQMNFFSGELIRRGGEYFAVFDGREFELSGRKNALLAQRGIDGGDVTIGVRPENIMLLPAGSEDGMEAEVDVVERLGGSVNIHAKAGGQRLVMTAPSDCASELTEKIRVDFHADAIHLFAAETGISLTYSGSWQPPNIDEISVSPATAAE